MSLPSVKVVAVAVAALALAFAVYVALHGTSREAPAYQQQIVSPDSAASTSSASPSATPTVEATTAIFIGDSYTIGTKAAPAYPKAVCRVLGWTCRVDAEPDTGYVASGDTSVDASYPDRLKATRKKYRTADVIVITGGLADLGRSRLPAAVDDYFADVRSAYPSAKIIAVEPFWVASGPSAAMSSLQSEVQEAAKKVDGIWVSTDGWLDADLVTADGSEPTPDGQLRLVSQMILGLRAAMPVASPTATTASASASASASPSSSSTE
jgi:hypothetical protein